MSPNSHIVQKRWVAVPTVDLGCAVAAGAGKGDRIL
jgi:hypothetical protein